METRPPRFYMRGNNDIAQVTIQFRNKGGTPDNYFAFREKLVGEFRRSFLNYSLRKAPELRNCFRSRNYSGILTIITSIQ